MLPGLTLPGSLVALLGALRPCFTAPSFRTFCGLAAGLAGQPRRRTVVGMLLGAGLSRAWPHDRAHYFFARARWEIDELGLAVARRAVLLVPVGAPLTVAVDDSLFRRAGRKVYGAGSQDDGSSPAQDKLSFGTCFVVAGIVVHLPFLARPVCLPVLGRLVPHGGKTGRAAKGGTKTTAGRKKDSAPGSKAERDTDERRRAQAFRVFPAVVGDKPQPPRLIHPYAHNASDLPIYDTQIWYAEPGVGISGPENVGHDHARRGSYRREGVRLRRRPQDHHPHLP
jgi:hypothetical protein